MDMEALEKLFARWAGTAAESVVMLKSAGSDRKYVRLKTADVSAIGVAGTSVEENNAFFSICRHFHAKNLPVPELYAVADDGLHYLQEDLGDVQLFDFMAECRRNDTYDDDTVRMLRSTASLLADVQFRGAEGLDFSVCYPAEAFNRRRVLWDLNYFKYYFLKPSGIDFNENRLEDDFDRMAEILLEDEPFDTFMYRDFQSRNVMIHKGMPRFIDFQGGQRGPVEYDIVSFIWQARAAYPAWLRKELADTYMKSVTKYRDIDPDAFRASMDHFALFRTLQVLGAYGYRGNFERKPQFLDCIPAAVRNLREIISQPAIRDAYPYMTELLDRMTDNALRDSGKRSEDDGRLTVRIASFSYRNGIPEDASGNGGGFVFDCRSMHNPGRYDEYKPMTGRDAAVIEFLDKNSEIQEYLQNVYGLVDAAVRKYVSRGFTSLAVNFGCTGGRHRSVRCAECTAAHLHELFGDSIRITLTHRELNICRKI